MNRILKGAAIGAGCGLVASGIMNVVPAIWSKLEASNPEEHPGDDATVKAAKKIAEPVLGRDLTPAEKKAGGPIVHFVFGSAMGTLYGILAEVAPPVTVGLGTGYASAVWLLGDEFAVPKLGLAPPPSETRAKGHFKYWLTHAIYGLTLEGGRRLAEKML